MAGHFARRTLIKGVPLTPQLPQAFIEFAATLTERRRAQYLAARMLLAELMMQIYGIVQLPEMTLSSCLRPCFTDPDLPDFSIAYAGCVVGVLLAEEDGQAGLGMEILRVHTRQTQELYLRDLSSGERAWINAQTDPVESATQLWAMRKSLLKLTGGAEERVSLHPASGRLRALNFPDIQAISDVESSLIWSCALSTGSERLQLWEMQEDNKLAALQTLPINQANMGERVLRLTSMPLEKCSAYSR